MNFNYLKDYKKHPDAKVNPSLLWEFDLSKFDYQECRNVVVQRVIERGWPEDWWAILNLYGEDGVKEAIRTMPYLNDGDMKFMSRIFEIPLTEMNCYHRKRYRHQNWNS
ncbi:MAG: hypothetical protein JSU01_09670 [Bacteroidetes bacterium]|nr:hypothetical protein [Bacteroidota bacterium]